MVRPLTGETLAEVDMTVSGANATKALHQTIREFNESTAKQTKTMIRLTWAMLLLTVIMTIAVFVQIWLALRPAA